MLTTGEVGIGWGEEEGEAADPRILGEGDCLGEERR